MLDAECSLYDIFVLICDYTVLLVQVQHGHEQILTEHGSNGVIAVECVCNGRTVAGAVEEYSSLLLMFGDVLHAWAYN